LLRFPASHGFALFTIQVTNRCRAYVLEFIQLLDEVLKNSLFALHSPRSELMADEKRDSFREFSATGIGGSRVFCSCGLGLNRGLVSPPGL